MSKQLLSLYYGSMLTHSGSNPPLVRRVLVGALTTTLAAGFAAGLAGCVQDPTVPKLAVPPIALAMTFSTKIFRLGKADTIRVTAINSFSQSATILFSTSCQIVLTIRNAAGDPVVPPGGKPLCVNVVSRLSIASGDSVIRRFVWNGATNFMPPGSVTPLPPGTYFVSASMSGTNYSTFAPAVKVDLVRSTP